MLVGQCAPGLSGIAARTILTRDVLIYNRLSLVPNFLVSIKICHSEKSLGPFQTIFKQILLPQNRERVTICRGTLALHEMPYLIELKTYAPSARDYASWRIHHLMYYNSGNLRVCRHRLQFVSQDLQASLTCCRRLGTR